MNTLPKINGSIPKDHPDLLLLIKNTDADSALRSTIKSGVIEGYYLRVSFLRYWGPNSIEGLKNSFAKTNEAAQEYAFELTNVDDYEMEYDGDRYWNASFSFVVHKKN